MRASLRRTVFAGATVIGLPIFGAALYPAAAAPQGGGGPVAAGQPATPVKAESGHQQQGKIEQQIADLHAKLQITPSQQPQWDQFAQVMRDNARRVDESFQRRVEALPGLTAPENIQSYAQVAEEHAQDVQKLVPAFQALYATMTDTQKRTADQVFRADAHHGGQARHG
jgi:protein CpxP